MSEKPRMFVAMSYEDADKKINETIISVVLKRDFSIEPANLLSAMPPHEKVPSLIREADIFAAIVTKRFKIEGTDKSKPSDWIQQEIGMAQAYTKPCLIFKECGVELEGITKSIATLGEFDRESIDDCLGKFIESAAAEAKKLKEDRITKIEGWFDTRKAIEDVFDYARKYVRGVVEDFSSIDKFKDSLDRMDKNVDFVLISSPYGDDVSKLESEVMRIHCKKKEVRFINPSSIGKVRMLFNEKFGLFVIHGRGEEYFGIRIAPVDDLESHFEKLIGESLPDKESARMEGKFCEISRNDLASSVVWAIKKISEFEKRDRFIYILSSQFTLFVTNEELQKAIVEAARTGGCKIKFVLSKKILERGNHTRSISEILKEKLGQFKNASFNVLKENYPLGRRRMIITNKIALDILDFGEDRYYYSTIQDSNHIDMLKKDFEKLPFKELHNTIL